MSKSPSQASAGTVWAILSVIFAASVFLPLPGKDGSIAHLPSLCPFYTLTGLPCPGCGLTRSFVSLGHGQWETSLHWHPLGWLVAVILISLWLRNGLYCLRGTLLWSPTPRATSILTWAGVAGLLLFGAARIGWLTVHHLHF